MSLVGSYISSSGARKAEKAQAKAAVEAARLELQGVREGIAYQTEAEARAREDIAPWRQKGVMALDELYGLMEAGPGEFETSPGYEFRQAEGLKAIERSAAARGGALSGGGLKAITRFGQDYATSDYDNFLRRYYDKLNPWQSLADIGRTAAGTSADITTQTGRDISSALIAGGQVAGEGVRGEAFAKASGYINQANIWSSTEKEVVGSVAYLYGAGAFG
uniref:Uncharacterized protein n=1 Tax=viral metagenome TaxID=1070528 RepID=A0A6M3J0Z7_9ZZZZ